MQTDPERHSTMCPDMLHPEETTKSSRMPRAVSGLRSMVKLQWSVGLSLRTESPFTMVTASERSVLTPFVTDKRLLVSRILIGAETLIASPLAEKCKQAAMVEQLTMAVFYPQTHWR